METHPIFCYAHKETHDFTVAELEQLVYVLQAGELTATLDRQLDLTSDREPDAYDCLQTWLEASGDSEAYLEHVEQAVACRRALAGDQAGDMDLCGCGELIRYVTLPAAAYRTISRWEHTDSAAWDKCRDAKPDPGRTP